MKHTHRKRNRLFRSLALLPALLLTSCYGPFVRSDLDNRVRGMGGAGYQDSIKTSILRLTDKGVYELLDETLEGKKYPLYYVKGIVQFSKKKAPLWTVYNDGRTVCKIGGSSTYSPILEKELFIAVTHSDAAKLHGVKGVKDDYRSRGRTDFIKPEDIKGWAPRYTIKNPDYAKEIDISTYCGLGGLFSRYKKTPFVQNHILAPAVHYLIDCPIMITGTITYGAFVFVADTVERIIGSKPAKEQKSDEEAKNQSKEASGTPSKQHTTSRGEESA